MFLPGELSVQWISPVFLFIAMKLGASGAGIVMWASSTPLLVLTNRMSPQAVTEQLHMLCCEVPSWSIMFIDQMTSASSLSSGVMSLNAERLGPTSEIVKSRLEPFDSA